METKVVFTKDRRFVEVIGTTAIPFVVDLPDDLRAAIRAMDDINTALLRSMLIPLDTSNMVKPYGMLNEITPETSQWIQDLFDEQANQDK